jgi:pimeloyl-ACP methyl ester carboxylesterase
MHFGGFVRFSDHGLFPMRGRSRRHNFSGKSSRSTLWALFVAIFFAGVGASGQSSEPGLRYKLHAGDHLVYREVFEREGKSSDQTFRKRAVFRNDVVVLAEAGGTVLVGIQRNRQSAEMLDFREHGKDKLAQETANFNARMAKRSPQFSDANVFSATGTPQAPLTTVREVTSKLLYGIPEILPLPAGPGQAGVEVQGRPSGMTVSLLRFDPASGEACAVFADTGTRTGLHLSYTFCPQQGVLTKVEFNGEGHEFGDSIIHERMTLELVEVRHSETPAWWLADPQVQQGALSAYLIAGVAAPDSETLATLLRTGSPQVQALTVAVYYQKNLTPPQSLLRPLLNSKSAELQRIASRFQASKSDEANGPCPLPAPHYERQKPGTTLRSMTTPSFDGVPFMVHVPLDYRSDQPFPLLIYLSGGAGQAFDAALTAEDLVGHSGLLAVYPNAGGAMWWDQKPTAMVHDLLLEILHTYNVDTNRVYLAGFSNGGSAALYFGTLWPERWAAIASQMGAGVNSPSGETLPLKNVLNVPLLFLHGDKDTLIPSSASVVTYDDLRGLHPRVPPELHILKGRGHEITLAEDDGLTMPFLERFTRNTFPRSIAMKITSLKYPRRYWAEVLEKDGGTAEIEGHILPGNSVEIKTRNVRKLRLLLRQELFDTPGTVRVRVNGKEQPAQELKANCELFVQSAQQYGDPSLAYTDEMVIDVPK